MNDRKDTIFDSGMRKLFVTLCGVIGFFLALVPIFFLIGGVTAISQREPEQTYSLAVVPAPDKKREELKDKGPVILKLSIDHIIGLNDLTTEKMRKKLIESREGKLEGGRIKALYLTINSPGGGVIDSDGIYRLIKQYKNTYKVPVYAHVDGLCASGGYYIAAAADKIYASEVSLVGSVGVYIPSFFNLAQLLEKIGVETKTFAAGEGKDAMNPFRAWKEGEGEQFKEIVDAYYLQFVDIVTKQRPQLSKTNLVQTYGARVYPASKALEYGYIDAVTDDFQAPLKELAAASGLADGEYQVVEMEDKNWISHIFDEAGARFTGRVRHTLSFLPEYEPELIHQFLYLYRPL